MKDVIKRSPLFKNVSDSCVDNLSKAARLVRAERGDEIIKDGEMGSCLYLIQKGTVSISKKLTMLEEHELDVMDKELKHISAEQNGFFGEMVISTGEDKRSATVTAATDCELLELDSSDINKIFEKDSESAACFYKNLAQMLTVMLRKSNTDILKLTTALSLALDE